MSQQLPSATILSQKKELNLFAKSWVGNNQAIAVASALKSNSSLTFVGFRECKSVDSVGAIAIAKALKVNNTLRKLSLESTKVDDRGAIALAEAILFSGLTRIDLNYTSVGDAGAVAFAQVVLNETCPLVSLYLDFCPAITDAGATALLHAKTGGSNCTGDFICKLTTLGLKGTSTSGALRAQVEAAFSSGTSKSVVLPSMRQPTAKVTSVGGSYLQPRSIITTFSSATCSNGEFTSTSTSTKSGVHSPIRQANSDLGSDLENSTASNGTESDAAKVAPAAKNVDSDSTSSTSHRNMNGRRSRIPPPSSSYRYSSKSRK